MLDSNIEKPKKTRAQKILDDIENQLRKLIAEKKELYKKFAEKNREIETLKVLYQKDLEEAERIEHKLILLWDYWQREVEILILDKKIQAGVLPSEREVIMKEQLKLVEFNKTLEKGFRERKIDAEVVTEIKKRLGIWEGKKEEKK
ncbi:MAG: hypothetical protein I3273_03865 [Candidatus Moeniiplasma glomeromycotorum]|nr:hypothetical protein [Candidatus Moeniiplasma glomeromycotorum]MCE8162231.1 hypothetical protein [Candidatus Moeniiplasma glomeromycotorum]MCE8163287.1 hypothetical protein [Candidatus Moeniiplasma glomeromycotorum]MCE8166113.1 hypothetical protein [Candidatus Moeniiplasma glomeromycotorum]MCE8166630.1 hypothetical protein [Candidatus Moeniiplasma glomeromycotorum]